jgi:hypothetical protein
MQRHFRDVLDTGNIILNSQVARGGTERNYAFSDIDLDNLIRLALLYDEMREVFDMYTYQRTEARINRRSLVFSKMEHAASRSAAVSGERSTDHDQTRLALLSAAQNDVHEECRLIPVTSSDTFFRFLQQVECCRAGPRFASRFWTLTWDHCWPKGPKVRRSLSSHSNVTYVLDA